MGSVVDIRDKRAEVMLQCCARIGTANFTHVWLPADVQHGRFAKHVRGSRDNERTLVPRVGEWRDLEVLTEFAGFVARRDVPPQSKEILRLGRMSALQEPDGGVRGLVVRDTVGSSRTMIQQVAKACQEATAPFQYAFKSRAERSACPMDPRTTILSTLRQTLWLTFLSST